MNLSHRAFFAALTFSISVSSLAAKPLADSPLLPGTKIVPGDLNQNEFFIVADNEDLTTKTLNQLNLTQKLKNNDTKPKSAPVVSKDFSMLTISQHTKTIFKHLHRIKHPAHAECLTKIKVQRGSLPTLTKTQMVLKDPSLLLTNLAIPGVPLPLKENQRVTTDVQVASKFKIRFKRIRLNLAKHAYYQMRLEKPVLTSFTKLKTPSLNFANRDLDFALLHKPILMKAAKTKRLEIGLKEAKLDALLKNLSETYKLDNKTISDDEASLTARKELLRLLQKPLEFASSPKQGIYKAPLSFSHEELISKLEAEQNIKDLTSVAVRKSTTYLQKQSQISVKKQGIKKRFAMFKIKNYQNEMI